MIRSLEEKGGEMWWTIPCQDLIGWSPLGSERHRACSPLRPPIKIALWSKSFKAKIRQKRGLGSYVLTRGMGWQVVTRNPVEDGTSPLFVDQTCGNVFNDVFHVVHVHVWMILTGVVWFHVEPFILKKARLLYQFHHFLRSPKHEICWPKHEEPLMWCGVKYGDSGLGKFHSSAKGQDGVPTEFPASQRFQEHLQSSVRLHGPAHRCLEWYRKNDTEWDRMTTSECFSMMYVIGYFHCIHTYKETYVRVCIHPFIQTGIHPCKHTSIAHTHFLWGWMDTLTWNSG